MWYNAKMFEFFKNRFYHLKDFTSNLRNLIAGRLWLKILIGMFLGINLGLLLGPNLNLIDRATAETTGNWLALPGHFYLTIVQMIIIPLILASVIRGIADNKLEHVKKLGARIIIYFFITTITAVSIGIFVANFIKPGAYIQAENLKINQESIVQNNKQEIQWSNIPQNIIQILPSNPFESMVNKDMLQIVIFSIIFGIALVNIPQGNARPLLELFRSLQAVLLTIVSWAMYLAPFAVFGLLAQVTMQIGLKTLLGMGVYISTVLLGLLLLLLFYMIIVTFVAKRNFIEFLKKIWSVQLLAFSTSSSAAVMPLSIKTAEENLDIQPSTSHFIIPLGTTINMDGTALYQGVATIFLAQVFGIDLGLIEMVIITLVSVGASIGTPATPGAGVIILSTILASVGIPPSGIALILGVDRIIDMCRTAVNVTGDLVACVVMDRITQSESACKQLYEKIT